MSVGFKSPLSSANTNAAFVSKIVDSTSVAKLTLNKPSEGTQVTSVQAAINKAFEGVGTTGEADTSINNYSSNNYIVDGDSRKVAIEKLDTQLKTTQDQLSALDLINSEDLTLANVGSTPSATGASLSGQVLTLQPADGTNGGVVSTTTQTFAGNKTFLGGVTVDGNLTVNGTTTTVNSTTVDTVDPNITVNKTGNDASSEGAGITVDRTGTKGSLAYDNALASKFKIGDLGSEAQVVTVSHTQTLTNKTLTSPAITTPTGIVKGDVGLGNVTNDSQLKRAANDFNTFTEKTTLVDDDVFIIEDSAASGAKKFVKKVNLGSGSGSSSLTVTTIKTANYTMAMNELARASATGGAFTLTLPTAVGVAGQRLAAYRTDQTLANIVTINTTSSQTIGNFGTSVTLATQDEYWLFVSDGANWIVDTHTYPSVVSAWTPTWAGVTGGDEGSYWWRGPGGLYGRSVFSTTTPTGSSFSQSIPSGLTIDSAAMSATTNANAHGLMYNINAGASAYPASSGGPYVVFSDTAVSNTVLYASVLSAGSRFGKSAGTSLMTTGARATLNFAGLPITNWKG